MPHADLTAPGVRPGPRTRPGAVAVAAVIALIVALPVAALLVVAGRDDGPARIAATDAAALDAWMAEQAPGAPLAGLGHVLVAEGARNGIDPRVLAAIARHESALGTAGSGAGIHNAFGWGPAIPFASWRQNIATVARGLAEGYVAQGRATLAEIQPVWAPLGAANDPDGLNSSWLAAVSGLYAAMGADPGRPVTLEAQAPRPPGPRTGPAGLATPTGGAGAIGGGPGEGTHSASARPDDWQSDRAVDIALPFGSPLYAVEAGRVVGIGGDPTDVAGRFGGARLTLASAADRYFYAHLSATVAGEGERVARGELIGFSGSAGGVEHLHLGVMRAEPGLVAGLP